jgi:hypothetical protein
MQIIGNSGSSIDSTNYGFVLVAASLPSFDTYQDFTSGERSFGLNNITLTAGTKSTRVDVDNNQDVHFTNDGLLFQDPTNVESTDVNAALENLQVVHFPGNALAAQAFNGEFRGYNVYAGASGGNCVDIENKGNPYRFYGLTVTGCRIGINLVSTGGAEYFGANVFGNDIDVSVSGTTNKPQAFIVFDGLHLDKSTYENMFLDQQNETVVCTSNCTFGSMNSSGDGGDGGSSVVVGPDAVATDNPTGTVLRLNQGFIKPDPGGSYKDIVFDTNGNGETCKCNVALGDGMLNVANGNISSNQQSQISGPIYFGGPAVGTPLQLNANEMGMAVSTDAAGAPGTTGLKLRVQCGSLNDGKAALVVLAGTNPHPITLLDEIGSGVTNCGP